MFIALDLHRAENSQNEKRRPEDEVGVTNVAKGEGFFNVCIFFIFF